ncbi:hypothetical protein [Sphingomonas mesophila]|uniref:hypothetical protein n=1 Tax=Sphingomonas mesophila TaxID=2303576 RepID=UPI000E57CAD3|nr:hypothetical protein [Sphingomonas mesophila]
MSNTVERIDSTDGVDLALGAMSGSAEASSLLERQSLLIQAQETLARADLRHRGWQIISERVGAVLKALGALAGILILVGLASFLWSASRASGMVVDSFSVPPDFERQGYNGTVVAEQLLDKVVALEAATQSARAPSSYEDSFSDSNGVVVPYAGVSLGQLRREMRDWLGSETRLSGELVRLPGGRLAVSFRTTSGLSGRVEGTAGKPDRLLDAAAMAMFKATQPYRYSVYQGRAGNDSESAATLEALSQASDGRERLWALHGLALNGKTQAETVAVYNQLLAIDPNFVAAVGNIYLFLLNDGREELGFEWAKRAAELYARGAPDYNVAHGRAYGLDVESTVASLQGDRLGAVRLAAAAERTRGGIPQRVAGRPFETAFAHAGVYDFASARDALAAAGYLDPKRRAEAEKLAGPYLDFAGLRALATGDDAGVVAAQSRFLAALNAADPTARLTGPLSGTNGAYSAQSLRLAMARRLIRLGQLDEAETALAGLRSSHDGVLRAQAALTAARGDDRRSDALFRRVVARAPSLPAAHYAWAEARMQRRDFAAAIAYAGEAHRKGPRWAEPLKLWGDALYAQGKSGAAAERYAMAAERAPRWGRLRMRWAAALWQAGDRAKALDQLGAAATMDLTSADRQRLRALFAAAGKAIGC